MRCLFIQIPCYNEETTLPAVIADLPRRIDGIDEIHTLIIDDGCTDNTVQVARQLGVDHIVRNGRNLGLARTFSRGLEACLSLGADIIVNIDGDNQHPAREIPRLLQPILDRKADVVVGCRDIANHREFSPFKRFLERLGGKVVRRLSGTQIPDVTSGFRAIDRAAAVRVSVMSGFSYTLEMLIQAGRTGLKVAWVPVSSNPMTRGPRLYKSNVGFVLHQVQTLLSIYVFYCPMQFFSCLAGLFFLISVLLSGRIAYYLWFSDIPAKIRAGTMGLLLFTSLVTVLLLVTGLLGSVLSGLRFLMNDHRVRIRNMELQQGTPPFNIDIETSPKPFAWAAEPLAAKHTTNGAPPRKASHRRSAYRLVLMQPPLRNVVSCATPDYVSRNTGHLPPIGLLYIQAAVENSRHESMFLDADLEGWDHRQAAREALSHGPDLVGLQATTFTLPDAYMVARQIKQLDPDVTVILGGPHPTIYPKQTAGLEAVDFAFAGEGEVDFVRFLDVFGDHKARANVPGIASKSNGEVTHTPSSGWLKDLDALKLPARRASRYKDYCSVLGERNSFTVMISSRGCPFDCIFCNRMGRKYRCHCAQYVLDEIEDIISLGIENIFIHDDTFSLNRGRVQAICEGIIERGYRIEWDARTRVDCVDEPLLALMRKAGCRRLSFGVESGSPRVLKAMRKGIDLDRVEKVFQWSRKEGIVTLADFMLGNISETRQDIERTLEFAAKINPDFVQYSICSPYPGTPLYEIGLDRGMFQRDIWEQFARDPLQEFRSPVWTENFTEEELVQITAAAYRSFYMRPSFVFKQLGKVKSLKQFKAMAKGAIGMLRS